MYVDPGVKTLVCHTGPSPKSVGVNGPNVTFVPQSPANKHYGDACRQLIAASEGEDLLFLNDDTVLTPETWPVLANDIRFLNDQGVKLGLLGLRSNFSAGIQNIRTQLPGDQREGMYWGAEHKIVETDCVFGVAFYMPADAVKAAGTDWTQLHWYSDNLLSWDLKNEGFRHFVSRAYIHHHGSQSGMNYEKYLKEAHEWLKEHRPDYPLT